MDSNACYGLENGCAGGVCICVSICGVSVCVFVGVCVCVYACLFVSSNYCL